MNDKITGWKQAKELCEEFSHLPMSERIKSINSANVNDSIKQKALKLLTSMEEKFDLIDSSSIEKIFENNQQNINLSGKIIDGYELISLLGSGGMSSVYLAKREQADIQKLVALKILSPYACDQKYLELFNREQKSLSQLNHNSIVSFHHGGQAEDGSQYLVMDYVENATDIVTYFNAHQLDNRERIEAIKTIAQAMSYAHSKGIIHRDLKTANILMDGNGEVKIVDFGISLFVDTKQTLSGVSTRCFTLDIASPEQIQGKIIDARTDVFSLGALLMQLTTQQNPLPKVNVSQYKPIEDQKHVNKVLRNSDLSTDLKNIISTAMHIDLEKRYADMQSFAEDLDNFLNHLPVKATSDSIFYRTKKLISRNMSVSLLGFSLLLITFTGLFLIKSYFSESQQSQEKNSRSMAIIDALFEQADPFKSRKNTQELIETLESIKQSQKALLAKDPEFKYHFHHKMANILDSAGNYSKALGNRKIALKSLSKFTSVDDEQYLNLETLIMHLEHAVGNYQVSIDQANQFIIKVDTMSKSFPNLKLDAYYLLSKSFSALYNYDKAIEIGELAKSHIKEFPDTDKSLQASMLNSFAVIKRNTGQPEQAGKLYQEAITILKGMDGNEKMLSTLISNYAMLKGRSGDYEASEKLFIESLNIIKKVDPTHPRVASIYMPYSTLLSLTNRLDEAEQMMLDAVEIFKKAQNEQSLVRTYNKLIQVSLRQSNVSNAVKYIALNREKVHKFYPIDHPDSLYYYNLSLWLLMLEPLKEQAQQVLGFLNKQDYQTSLDSREYNILQVHNALLKEKTIDGIKDFSLITEYLFNVSKLSTAEQLLWLDLKLETPDVLSSFTQPFINIWRLEIKADRGQYQNYCMNDYSWLDSSRLALKVELIEACIHVAESNNFETPKHLLTVKNKIENDVNNSANEIKKLVQQLMSPITKDR